MVLLLYFRCWIVWLGKGRAGMGRHGMGLGCRTVLGYCVGQSIAVRVHMRLPGVARHNDAGCVWKWWRTCIMSLFSLV
jgi:hypothetical protein